MKRLLIILFSLSFVNGFAQGFYNKGTIVSLSTNAILTVPDSLLNTGTIINDGDLQISGAWVNLGTYEVGTGQINFNSNQVQTINHNSQSFGRLTISGTGEKQFLANITIESELDLQSSVLKSVNNAKIILNQGAIVLGGSDQSHIVGPVEAKGTGDWLFPIGNGTTYLPVEMLGVMDATASATLTLNELSAGQTLTGDFEIAKLSSKRYWELVLGGGSLNQSKIKLPLSDDDGLTDNLDLLVVAGSSNALNSYTSIGQSDLSGNLTLGSVMSEESPAVTFFAIAALTGETDIEVFNGISVSVNGKNDFLRIRNIELYPNNQVTIFNRWGDRVFDMPGYDNDQKSFRGESNQTGTKLPSGTYFYSIDLGDSSVNTTGYLVIK
jgi:gliding motility-associated-like protein